MESGTLLNEGIYHFSSEFNWREFAKFSRFRRRLCSVRFRLCAFVLRSHKPVIVVVWTSAKKRREGARANCFLFQWKFHPFKMAGVCWMLPNQKANEEAMENVISARKLENIFRISQRGRKPVGNPELTLRDFRLDQNQSECKAEKWVYISQACKLPLYPLYLWKFHCSLS